MVTLPHIAVDASAVRPTTPLRPSRYRFPDPDELGPSPVLRGGDFAPETVVAAYRAGFFPWPHGDKEHLWFSPDPRAVLRLEDLHVARRLARTMRTGCFRATVDAAFERVIDGCAEREEGTWITPGLREGYLALHALGWAHSIEVWDVNGELAGGLYGVAVGALFGAESMFHRVTDASKAALIALVTFAERIGVGLIDVQVLTPHTAGMGCAEVPRALYLEALRALVELPVSWVERAAS